MIAPLPGVPVREGSKGNACRFETEVTDGAERRGTVTTTEFQGLLDDQVSLMLAVGRSMHPETFDDAGERSYRALPKRWMDRVHMEFLDGLGDVGDPASSEAVVDQGHDVSGLFMPADSADGQLPRIAIDSGSFFRKHFTAFHELGHFLQRTDLDCYAALYAFDDTSVAKRFEEKACNQFAAEALLPDDMVRRNLSPDGIVASDACSLFREAHFASRQVVARRLAEYLPVGGSVALFDTQGRLSVRALASGEAEYGVEPTREELRAWEELRRTGDDELILESFGENGGGIPVRRVSVAFSRSSWGANAFVVVR